MSAQVYLSYEVNDMIEKIRNTQGMSKEGFVDLLLRLSLLDAKRVDEAVAIAKAYNIPGTTTIDEIYKKRMGKP
ncbi:MAG: hypothetical protein ABSF44_08730 [Candidatus Bathyarchaeia archaeon]|jgi:hypothetical protein